MRITWLRSMRLQTAAVIVAGFALSHVAGYLIYTQDRGDALLVTEALNIAERAAGVSRLIRDLPADWRGDVAHASDSRAFRVWFSREPAFEVDEPSTLELDVIAYLRVQVPRIANHEMRARILSSGRGAIQPPGRLAPPGTLLSTDTGSADANNSQVVAITINHRANEWLNFLGLVNTPPAFLPEFLGVNLISAVFGIGLIAFWLVHRVTEPLLRLTNAAERLGTNINASPLPENGPSEVGTAAAAFNRMQRRLKRLIEGRTEMLAAISHDLRSPITRMRLRTELMAESEENQKTLETLAEMEAIIATFLDYARATNETEENSRSDLGAIIESLCIDLAESGMEVTCEAEIGHVVSCKRLAIKRAVTNLVENAVKYGERARVFVGPVGSDLVVRIDDDGPGIAEQDIETVFVPFYSGEASRNRSTGGVGLGLSIVQAVVEDHGGKILLTNRPEGGLRAEMIIPLE